MIMKQMNLKEQMKMNIINKFKEKRNKNNYKKLKIKYAKN